MNELEELGTVMVVILDDYHWITDPVCHETIEFLVERQPANLSLVVSSRMDPALPLARVRASRELLELRAADLSFTLDETERFLNGVLGLDLGRGSLDALQTRTEGWPAGLYLAYLSLRESSDREGFIADFSGSSRHVADYLSEVVLDNLDEPTRDFMLATSILDRLSGPLCDAITGRDDSAHFLEGLERSNSFLIPLDDRREWYRYHRLFSELLQDDLHRRDPHRIPDLHRRASSWFAGVGDVGEAIRHATEAGDLEEATMLVCTNYLPTIEWGGFGTVARWLEFFPRTWVVEDGRLSIVEAWVMSFLGRREEADIALEHAAAADYDGPLPDGASSIVASIVLVRAGFPWGNVGRMVDAARRAYRFEGHRDSIWSVTVHVQLGWALCLIGDFGEARAYLETAVRLAPPTQQWLNAFGAMCLLAWICLETDETDEAERWARSAVGVAEGHHLDETAPGGWADATLGAALAAAGRSREADELLARGIERLRTGAQPLLLIQALLAHAQVRDALGAHADARGLVNEARRRVHECTDAGILASRVDDVAHALARHSGFRPTGELTGRETEVLRLLEKGLSKREIGRTLYLSFNTIHSHTRSIYRKLDASTREEAIRHALERGLL
jgi:LuxR family maltose regulon positive regulatory protein